MERAPWLSEQNLSEKTPARARKTRATDPIGDDTRKTVRGRSGGVCELCGEKPGSHYHHRQLRRGGNHGVVNIVHLCAECHTRCHGHQRWALDTGWIVSQYDEPAFREVLYRGRDWAYLGADGSLLHKLPLQEPPC